MSYDGWVLTFLSESKSEEVNAFQISNCEFYSINAADSEGDKIFDSLKNLFLGKEGGLSSFLINQHKSTNISIRSCVFYHNSALSGGAIYLAFVKFAQRNHIEISDTQFVDNCATFSGGAIQIIKNSQYYSEHQHTVHVSYSFFIVKKAGAGRGLTYMSGLTTYRLQLRPNQEMKIIYCEFMENVGTFGSTIYLSQASVLWYMVNITKSGLSFFSLFFQGPPLSTVMGIGALYLYQSHVVINGTPETPSRVSGNLKAGLVLDYSHLYVLGTVLFEKNQGSKGGAISMYEESAIYLFDTTNLTFHKNSAVKGAAIYVYLNSLPINNCHSHELCIYECLIRYHHRSIESLKGNVMFNDNMAAGNDGGAIFANTL